MADELTKEQSKILQKLIDELNEIASDVFNDYIDNPSELSGSITQVHTNSPILDKEKDDSK